MSNDIVLGVLYLVDSFVNNLCGVVLGRAKSLVFDDVWAEIVEGLLGCVTMYRCYILR